MNNFQPQSLLVSSLSTNEKKIYFKNFIELIEIEIFSYCNRTCWFCPNSFIDRKSINQLFPESSYLKILDFLNSIDYTGFITYSRYNEPLSKKEIFLKRLDQAKSIVPNAKLITFTNSDFVTESYLLELGHAGLSSLFMQLYIDQNEKCTDAKVQKRIRYFLEKLHSPYNIIQNSEHSIVYNIEHRTIKNLRLDIKDFHYHGRNRGGTISALDSSYRINPCYSPFVAVYIDYNGNVMPCCNTRSDVKEHKSYILGNAIKDNLWDIFFSEKSIAVRKMLISSGLKKGACSRCNYLDSNVFPPDFKLKKYYYP